LLAVGVKLQPISPRFLFDPPLVLVALQASTEGDEPIVQAADGLGISSNFASAVRCESIGGV
jgi:hypothetical protein